MPWCEQCDRYLTPTSLADDGTCPNCDSADVLVEPPDTPAHLPWHFWVVVAAAVIYLGWRAIQGVVWLWAWVF